MPTYLIYEYIFFFNSNSGRIRIWYIFPAEPEPDLDQWKKMSDPHRCFFPLPFLLVILFLATSFFQQPYPFPPPGPQFSSNIYPYKYHASISYLLNHCCIRLLQNGSCNLEGNSIVVQFALLARRVGF